MGSSALGVVSQRSPTTVSLLLDHPDLIALPEGGALIGVSPHTVRGWIRQGRLPAYRFGHRTLRVRRSELLAMAEHVGADRKAQLDAHVDRLVAAAPALTESQRARLASLLSTAGAR